MDDIASIYVRPDAPKNEQYGVSIGRWDNNIRVDGFANAHEAYWWCVQVVQIDPLKNIPDKFRRWIFDEPAKEIDGLPLFEKENI